MRDSVSVTFIIVEKKIGERHILDEYNHLVQRCQEIFPFLSHSRILLDLQRLAVSRLVLTEAEFESRFLKADKP